MRSPAEPVRSRSNPLFRRLRALKHRGPEGGLMLLEGVKLIEEALDAGVRIVEVAQAARLRGERGRKLALRLQASGVAPRLLDDALFDSLTEAETSQGVLALAEARHSAGADLLTGVPLVLVACGVQNPGNLGGLLRTAEAAGATGAWLLEGCADPFSWKALRGSMGSAFRLPHLRAGKAESVARRLKQHALTLVATVAREAGAERYDALDYRGPTAFLLGGEGAGLDPALERLADRRAFIPMAGRVESLNVGVAAGILLFEAARQRSGLA